MYTCITMRYYYVLSSIIIYYDCLHVLPCVILQGTMSSSDESNIWKAMHGLSGTLEANSPNEAMSLNFCTITNIKTKANIFVNY